MFLIVSIYEWRTTYLAEKTKKYLKMEYDLQINLDCICSMRAVIVPEDGEDSHYYILEMINGKEYLIDSEDYVRIKKYLKE